MDVKYGSYMPSHTDSLARANFVLSAVTNNTGQPQMQPPVERANQQQRSNSHHKSNRHHSSKKKDRQFHPIYEEVSATSDENKGGGRSLDSDIEDSEVEGRTVASEDEFAEDELSVAGEYPMNPEEETVQQCSAPNLQDCLAGDLYLDGVNRGSERYPNDGNTSDNRVPKGNFRGLDVTSAQNKLTHSLERNKDGHHSNSFQAKQNYYLNKSMLGPDFTYPEGIMDGSSCVSPSGDIGQSDICQYPSSRAIGSSLNFIPVLLQQQQQQQQRSMSLSSRSASNSPPPPPYPISSNPKTTGQGSSTSSGVIPALYNPQIVSPNSQQIGRIPEALLRELSFKLPPNSGVATLPAVVPMNSRTLPVPPASRVGGSGVLFTVENPYPPQIPLPSMSRTRSGSATEFTSAGGRGGSLTYHPYPHHALSGGRPPTPPPPENIYASIDDVGPFTIDGSRHRSPFARKGSTDLRNTFGRSTSGRSSKSSTGDKFQSNNVPNRHSNEEGGSYGDIRPIYDSRTACS